MPSKKPVNLFSILIDLVLAWIIVEILETGSLGTVPLYVLMTLTLVYFLVSTLKFKRCTSCTRRTPTWLTPLELQACRYCGTKLGTPPAQSELVDGIPTFSLRDEINFRVADAYRSFIVRLVVPAAGLIPVVIATEYLPKTVSVPLLGSYGILLAAMHAILHERLLNAALRCPICKVSLKSEFCKTWQKNVGNYHMLDVHVLTCPSCHTDFDETPGKMKR